MRRAIGVLLVLIGLSIPVIPVGADRVQRSEQERAASKAVEEIKASVSQPDAAILRIPRFGKDWARVIKNGVSDEQLKGGIGHYPFTQGPGEIGNYGLAGHRSGGGSALLDIDKVRKHDLIMVDTADRTYVYSVESYMVTTPDDISVLSPVPNRPGEGPKEAWLTLTTCSPKYGNTERYIVFAKLH